VLQTIVDILHLVNFLFILLLALKAWVPSSHLMFLTLNQFMLHQDLSLHNPTPVHCITSDITSVE